MRRPAAARETLRLSPLVQAGWADASGIERLLLVSAVTRPSFFAGRQTAEAGTEYVDWKDHGSSLAQPRDPEQ